MVRGTFPDIGRNRTLMDAISVMILLLVLKRHTIELVIRKPNLILEEPFLHTNCLAGLLPILTKSIKGHFIQKQEITQMIWQ